MNKSNTLRPHTINIHGSIMDLSLPKVMGIINLTPDSFYSGSRHRQSQILGAAEQMIQDGAELLDVGGYSTRPGADEISIEEEIARICESIELLAQNFPQIPVSIDTFRSGVAHAAVNSGASIVNDISAGLLDDKMLETVGKLNVPYIAMHMRGTPKTMKELTNYDDLMRNILGYFSERLKKIKVAGIKDVIIDPGFGFAKTIQQNYYLLNHVDYLNQLGLPILVGVSRKSMIYKLLNIEPEHALNGTTVLNTLALLKGASFLRVHDVKEAVETVKLINQLTA